jgi:cell division protein FtsN
MSRDYKNGGNAPGRGSPLGVGVVIGLLLGLCLALGVALIINKGPNPFVEKKSGTPAATPDQKPSAAASGSESKTKFDFYKILPGSEEAVTDKEFRRPTTPAAKEVYFLQVAAFQNPADADNLKAQLALAGIEAKIQTAQLPDGKIWHRVRIGPFADMNELDASRAALKRNDMEANLIKVREPAR